MNPTRKFTQALLSLTMILSMLLSLVQTQPAAAQEGDGIKREVNAETEKVSFIGPEAGKRSVSARALGIAPSARASSPAAAALALAKRFAPEFGVTNPESDLTVMKTQEQEKGRVTVRYQQNYQGIPVIGGELIVNTNENGDLYSMNGEAAQDLAVDTQPAISAQEAIEIAKRGMVKWYGGEPANYQQTEPALWIFDEQLIRPKNQRISHPAELVWRMEMTSVQQEQPIRELILVDAKTGNIPLHFNQIDTAWGGTQAQDPTPTETPTPLPTEPPTDPEEVVPTETPIPTDPVTPAETPTPTETPLPAKSVTSTESERTEIYPMAFSGTTRYVASTGTNSGACTSSSSPCAAIQYAINQAANSDVIKVAAGTYYRPTTINIDPNVVILNKGVLLSGGWQSGFSSQTGVSIVDGQNTNNGILVTAASAAAVDRFMIQNSRTGSDSGGIYHAGANLTLQNSTVKNNTGGRGAGIFVINNATLTVVNSTISGNTASYRGAGIFVETGTVNVEYSTIAYNTATNSGGGVYRNGGTLNVHNSIIANNTNSTAPNCNDLSSSGNNIISSTTGCTVPAGTGNQLNVNPQIDASLTGTPAGHVLLDGSPAINAGDLVSCTANTGNRDQQGVVRPQGGGCDIGAIEFDDYPPGVPYSVIVSSGDTQEKQANQAFDHPLVVTVLDFFGTPVSDASVTFTAPASGASGVFASNNTKAETVTTNASGIGTSSTFTANAIAGSYNVVASISQSSETANFSLENLPLPGTPSTINLASGNNQQKAVNQAYDTPFSVSVLDYYGNPVSSGINVTFTAPASGASGTFASSANRIETVTTNASGIATSSIFTANSIPGTLAVIVSVEGTTATASFSLLNLYIPGVPTSITVVSGSSQQRHINQAFPNPFVTLVKDGNGDPVNGASVTFTAPPTSGASGTFASNTSRSENVLTDANGYATSSIFTANSMVGTYTVQATVTGVATPASFTIENQPIPGVPRSIIVTNGNNQRAFLNQAFLSPLTVRVLDGYGTGVNGISVTFIASVGGASGTFASSGSETETVITNNSGYATTSIFTANDQVGTYDVDIAFTGDEANPISSLSLSNIWGDLYVAPSGSDSNSCTSSDAPCLTINGAVAKAMAGNTIMIADGTYTSTAAQVVLIDKNITISGCWNSDFTNQSGICIIDGQNQRNGIRVTAGTVHLDRVLVINASAYGVWNAGTLTISNSTIQNSRGSGIYNNTGGNLSVVNSTLDHNISTSYGGAVYHIGSQLSIVNSTLSNNTATAGLGGGAYVASGTVSLLNVTVTQNVATFADNLSRGGGIYIANNPNVSIANSIIVGNAATENRDVYGMIDTSQHNLLGSDLVLLGNLADNGGLTYTHALMEGSAAIDGGSSCPDTDQRGLPRPQGAACDIGAFEGSISQTVLPTIRTYTANHTNALFAELVCSTSPCRSSNADANKAHVFALGTYNLYLTQHNRNGIDNNNMPILSTVQYQTGYENAFWNGAQMIYGDGYGFANADDIAAHELTHGVTESESGLLYYYQSGAIDESLADLWGEYYDQNNGLGNDAASVKWLLGEDTTGLGAVRSMSNPPAYKDPDKISSSYYVNTDEDNGGVHTNSGVNNKAVYLMVNGGAFNAKTVAALGWEKTAAIYYEAQTNLLTSTADYSDLYYAVQQACTNITGQHGITPNDCLQVRNALDAVQMNLQSVFVSDGVKVSTVLCPAGTKLFPATTLFYDDFESGTGKWAISGPWTLYSGTYGHLMWGNDQQAHSNATLTMNSNVYIPSTKNPTFLIFDHDFIFDYYHSYYYDGGVLEYSVNNGSSWQDAGGLFSAGKNYNGTIFTPPSGYESYGSALRGRRGFVGNSPSYGYSRYDLRSLAGQNVRFRWHFATDYTDYYGGWIVDDIMIYQCVGTPAMPALQAPLNNALSTDYTPYLNWADAAPTADHYELQLATNSNFASSSLVIDQSDLTNSEFTVPTELLPDTKYYWRIRVFNSLGGTLGWGTAWSFRTALAPPALSSSPQSGHSPTLRPIFNWDSVPNATGYTIQISTTSAFTTRIVNSPILPTFTPTADLLPNTTYYWHVQTRGANGPGPWSATWSFTTGNPPGIPVLAAPASNALSLTYQPKLDWNDVVNPLLHHYQLQIATNAAFTSDLQEQEAATSEFTPTTPLAPNQTYHWRVRSYTASGDYSAWSLVRTFRTVILPPVLTSPGNTGNSQNKRPTFTWETTSGASGYKVQVAKDSNFMTGLLNWTATTNTYTPTVDLLPNTTYYWHVQATGLRGPSSWSATWSFTTGNPPGIPVLAAPASNALSLTYQPKLDWNDVVNPLLHHYQLQIATNAAFTSDLQEQEAATSEFMPTTPLAPNQTYHWRVRSYTASGDYSAWSLVRTFRTVMLPPTLTSPINGGSTERLRPIFDWANVPGATGYTIQISTSPTFSPILVTANTITSGYVHPNNLPYGQTLYWRVKANGPNGPSGWTTFSFKIEW